MLLEKLLIKTKKYDNIKILGMVGSTLINAANMIKPYLKETILSVIFF